jgi:hypothetical protein
MSNKTSNKTSKKTTNEKTTNNQLTKFEKVNTIIANGSIIVLMVFVFWIICSSGSWLSKKDQDINNSIKSSERMHDEDVKRAEKIHDERVKMHKEYLDTIKASTSNIVEAIKSMKK